MESDRKNVLFRKSVEDFRSKISDMSRLLHQDEPRISIPSNCAGGILAGLSSELYNILQDDFSDDDFPDDDE